MTQQEFLVLAKAGQRWQSHSVPQSVRHELKPLHVQRLDKATTDDDGFKPIRARLHTWSRVPFRHARRQVNPFNQNFILHLTSFL